MMKIILNAILIFLLCLYCSSPTGKINLDRPLPLSMVQKTASSDTTLNENGIDAVPDSNIIQVVWHPYMGINEVKRFNIYRSNEQSGTQSFDFLDYIDIENSFEQDTTYLDGRVTLNQYYYYFVTVVDKDNQESFPSDTVKYQLLQKATASSPNGGLFNAGDTIQFGFIIPSETYANGYILRIERLIGANNKELTYIDYVNPFDNFGDVTIYRDVDTHHFRTLTQTKEYRWRIDVIAEDQQYEGSESEWATFYINWGN